MLFGHPARVVQIIRPSETGGASMKEYGPKKSLPNMTKEEKLVFGAKLIEAREALRAARDSLSGEPALSPINVYDIEVFCKSRSDFAQIREGPLPASDSEGHDADMRAAGIARCHKLRALGRELIDERLAEIESKLEAL